MTFLKSKDSEMIQTLDLALEIFNRENYAQSFEGKYTHNE